GSARLFGICLRENFDDPYLSKTPSEFWTRWHMSLSSWIRDYLFFPLAAFKRGLGWRKLALIISMIVFGMWHGVGATFVLWGIYHGLMLVVHRQAQRLRCRLLNLSLPSWLGAFFSWGLTFTCISFGWVIFRANGLAQVKSMYQALFSLKTYASLQLRPNFYILVSLVIVGYFAYVAVRSLIRRLQDHAVMAHLIGLIAPAYYAAIILAVIIWSKQTYAFVYLQF
ncbi:MAG: MBOAT family O-acyltransferase, partial [Chloroflexota bacterium]